MSSSKELLSESPENDAGSRISSSLRFPTKQDTVLGVQRFDQDCFSAVGERSKASCEACSTCRLMRETEVFKTPTLLNRATREFMLKSQRRKLSFLTFDSENSVLSERHGQLEELVVDV